MFWHAALALFGLVVGLIGYFAELFDVIFTVAASVIKRKRGGFITNFSE
jgi:hypothetical protein